MKKKVSLLTMLFVLAISTVNAKTDLLQNNKALKEVYGIQQDKFIRIPPPLEFLSKSTKEKTCDIQVDYIDFSDDAKKAFEYAVSIWETLLHSDQVIKVEAHWMDLSGNETKTVLGAATAFNFYVNKEGFPESNIFYNSPLAEKLARKDLNGPNMPDIYAYFNNKTNWYYGTDGQTPAGEFDLVSVVLHELCHGLGFLGSMDVTDAGQGIYSFGSNYPFVFDKFLYDGEHKQLVDTTNFENPSLELYQQLTGGELYFDGPVLKQKTGDWASLYAPDPFDPGSSIDHLGRVYDDTENTLMTPGITTASSIHDPGAITMAIMEDVGWSNIYISLAQVPNRETLGDVQFLAEIIPDFDTDLIDPTIHYSINDGDWQTNTLTSNTGDSLYASTVNITNDAILKYYISVNDKYGRTFNYPNTAPAIPDSVVIGTDTVAPVIKHIPDNYFLFGDTSLVLLCTVDDLFGIDTVYVEYSINGVEKTPAALQLLDGDTYNIVLDLSTLNLQIGDTISYHLVAKDNSVAENTTNSPAEGNYDLVVTQLPASVLTYTTDFETGSNEFIFNGFDFSTPKGFSSSSLNSEHPYENGGTDTYLDFTAELVFPIEIDETYHYLSFDEIALIEPGDSGTVYGDDNFYDYVIVEGSKDDGQTWIPFEDGWDCRLQPEWENAYYQSLQYNNFDILSDLDLYKNHLIDLTAPAEFNPGDIVKIRFRLNSDPFAVGWGWSIDNLQIQTIGLSVPRLNSPKVQVYPNPVTTNEIRISGIKDDFVQLKLFDYAGQMVFQKNNVNTKEKIVLPNLQKGLYILYLENKNQAYRTKLLFK